MGEYKVELHNDEVLEEIKFSNTIFVDNYEKGYQDGVASVPPNTDGSYAVGYEEGYAEATRVFEQQIANLSAVVDTINGEVV